MMGALQRFEISSASPEWSSWPCDRMMKSQAMSEALALAAGLSLKKGIDEDAGLGGFDEERGVAVVGELHGARETLRVDG
jgi:hypothetical protein